MTEKADGHRDAVRRYPFYTYYQLPSGIADPPESKVMS